MRAGNLKLMIAQSVQDLNLVARLKLLHQPWRQQKSLGFPMCSMNLHSHRRLRRWITRIIRPWLHSVWSRSTTRRWTMWRYFKWACEQRSIDFAVRSILRESGWYFHQKFWSHQDLQSPVIQLVGAWIQLKLKSGIWSQFSHGIQYRCRWHNCSLFAGLTQLESPDDIHPCNNG